ncbi:MAG: IS1096 element passenger TnpR family protein [Bacillota bacterium]
MSEKVKCNVCGKEYTNRGITRHLKSCPEIHKNDSEGNYKYYTLKIKDVYKTNFFLFINVSSEITLGQLDQFLRDIWVECCDHLSSFHYNNQYYDINRFTGSFSINLKLEKLLDKKNSILYEYDFGSTTKLKIELKEEFFDKKRDSLIEIYARNKMPKYLKENYDNPANSPRFGVCGYLGPADEFKNITSWGKIEKVKNNKN